MDVQKVCETLNVTEQQLFVRASKVYGDQTTKPTHDWLRWEQTGELPPYVTNYIKFRSST